ncbi:MAG: hypothetical protein WD060_14590 [Pirellulales bacterium]
MKPLLVVKTANIRTLFTLPAARQKAKNRRKKVHRVDLYPKVLIRPICGCCDSPLILGRSAGKYQSFFCFNASSGMRGCTNGGYKSARIIDDAALGTVMATLFTDGFIADLTADVNMRLAWIARQPIPSTKRERLKELQRASRRPKVKSVREQDVVAALGKLRDLLQGDVGVAGRVESAASNRLKALVGRRQRRWSCL